MGLCALNEERYMALVASVYKRLQEVAEDPLMVFSMDGIAKDIYNVIVNASGDKEQALGLAQHVPSAIKLITDIKPEISKALRQKGFSLDALALMQDIFEESLDNVQNTVTIEPMVELEHEVEIAAGLSADDQPQSIEIESIPSIGDLQVFHPEPLDYNSTTGNQTPERDFQYEVLQKIVSELQRSNLPDASNFSYGLHTGLRLKPVIRDAGIALIVTDNDGNILKFNEDKHISEVDEAKEVYFFLRNTKPEAEEKFIQDVISRYREAASKEDIYKEDSALLEKDMNSFEKFFRYTRKQQRTATENLIEEFNKDSSKNILVEITGGSAGYIPTGWVRLSDINYTESERKSLKAVPNTSGQMQITLDNSNKVIRVKPNKILREEAPDIIRHVAEFIARPLTIVQAGKARPLTSNEKVEYVKSYIFHKEVVYNGAKALQIAGKTFDLTKATAADIEKALIALPLLYLNSYYKGLTSGSAVEYIINEKDNTVVARDRNYLDFLIPHLYVETKGSDRGNLKLLNGYFQWKPLATPMPKIVQDVLDKAKEPIKKAKENEDPFFRPFERSRILESGATPEQIDAAEKWWKNNPLAKHIPLNVLFNIVNSDRWAEWNLAGITLYNGSNFTDVYHEAWHAFSQLYLSQAEKKSMYSALGKLPGKFKVVVKNISSTGITELNVKNIEFSKATDRQLEEYIAESFRDFSKSKGKIEPKTSLVRRIFQKIMDFFKQYFSKTDLQQIVSQPDQYNGLSEIFNKLYMGDITSYKPAVSNVMLDEAAYGAVALEDTEDILNFTESKILSDSIDGIISDYITKIAKQFGAKNTAKALSSKANMTQTYSYVKSQLDNRLKILVDKYDASKATLSPEDKESLERDIQTLEFAVSNFGDPTKVLDGTQKNGIVSFHRQNSKFYKFFQAELQAEDAEIDLEDGDLGNSARGGFDRSSTVDVEKEANAFTLYLIDSLIKVDNRGLYQMNRLGFPQLADPGTTWNNLIIGVSGSSSVEELYNRLHSTASNGFHIYKQILEKLGNPSRKDASKEELTMWMKFLQDMNKPRIPMVATTFDKINITPEMVIKKSGSEGTVTKEGIKLNDGTLLSFKEEGSIDISLGDTVEIRPADVDEETGSYAYDFDIVYPGKNVTIGTADIIENSNITVKTGRTAGDTQKVIFKWSKSFGSESAGKYIKEDKNGNNMLHIGNVVRDFLDTTTVSGVDTYVLKDPALAGDFLRAIGVYVTDIPGVNTKLFDKLLEINKFADAIGQVYNAYKNRENKPFAIRNPIEDIYRRGFKEGVRIKDGKPVKAYIENLHGYLAKIADVEIENSGEYTPLSRAMVGGKIGHEESLNNSMTVENAAFNKIKNFKELFVEGGIWYHMNHFNPERNPWTRRSVVLNSLFKLDLDPSNPEFGDKRAGITLQQINLIGAQLLEDNGTEQGLALTQMGALDKFMNDIHSMLGKGIIENPRAGSKNSSFAHKVSKIVTSNKSRREEYLYIDTYDFTDKNYETGFHQAYVIMSEYLSAEMERIKKIEDNPEIYNNIKNFDRGKDFMLYDDILESSTKVLLKGYKNLEEARAAKPNIDDIISRELRVFFDKEILEVETNLFNKYNGMLPQVYENILKSQGHSTEQIKAFMQTPTATASLRNAAIRSFVYNTTIHNVEMDILYYGDTFQYNHSKDEKHKRISMWQSTGDLFATGPVANRLINTYVGRDYAKKVGAPERIHDGTLNTAVIQDSEPTSYYFPMLDKLYRKDGENRNLKGDALEIYLYGKDKGKIGTYSNPVGGVMKPYHKITETDGQAWISMDTYRILSELEGNWSSVQDAVYRKVINGQSISATELIETFPVRKLQYTGPTEMNNMPVGTLPILAGHKFSLFPLIPTVIEGTPMQKLHDQMVMKGYDYVLTNSGSKLSQINKKGDEAFTDDNTADIKDDIKFTNNRIYINFLKNQLKLSNSFKDHSTFATQIRGLISSGLYEQGVPTDYKGSYDSWNKLSYTEQLKVSNIFSGLQRFNKSVEKIIDLNKKKIVKQVGWTINEKGDLVEGDPETMLSFIKGELERQEIPKHEIDEIHQDISTHFSAPKVESVLMSIINNRLVRQHVRGEALVEVSVAFTQKFKKPTEEEKIKYQYGTSGLPYYIPDLDGKTSTKACKVKVALSGSFTNLFNATDKEGNRIGVYDKIEGKYILNQKKSLDKLNSLIRDNEWLDTENNRKMVTITGVRIPVQGDNSMEFAEVYEFLPSEAGPIIILPTEVVAKSGTDFDVDKLTTYMPYISKDGKWLADEDHTEEELNTKIEKLDKDYNDLLASYLKKTGTTKDLEKELLTKAQTNQDLFKLVGDLKEEKTADRQSLIKDLRTKLQEVSELRELPKAIQNVIAITDDNILLDTLKGINSIEGLDEISPEITDVYNDIDALNLEFFNKITIPESEITTESKEIKAFRTALKKIKRELSPLKEYKKNKIETVQNTMIDAMQDILRLPEKASSLLKPNDTHIAKPVSEELESYVQEYNPRKSYLASGSTLKKGISPTRTFSYMFNLKKHQDNIVSKSALAITAVDNKYDPLNNEAGTHMEDTIQIPDFQGTLIEAPVKFRMNTNSFQGDKTKVSLSNRLDSNDEHNIQEIKSQLMNGMVDAEKDAWVAFIQGNVETIPTILFLVSAGIPFKEVIYFVSNPLTRRYIQLQKSYKGALAELVTGKTNDPSRARSKARSEMWKEIGMKGKNPTNVKTLYNFIQGMVGSTDFDLSVMHPILEKNDTSSTNAKAAMLQFMYLEELSKGYEAIKQNTNVDTKRTPTLLSAELRTLKVKELMGSKYFPERVTDYFVNKSVLKGFFVQDFATKLYGPSFKLYNHPLISKHITDTLSEYAAKEDVKNKTGYEEDKYISEFRNGFMSYLFSNYVEKFTPNQSTGYKSMTVKYVEGISKSAHVKQVAGVPTLFINMKNLKKEFSEKLYLKSNLADNNYIEQELAPVDSSIFDDTATSLRAYNNFVIEREYLRSTHPLIKVSNTYEYKEQLAKFTGSNIIEKHEGESVEDYNKRLEKQAYEVWLKNKALDNTLNFNHLFKSKDGNYASRVRNIMTPNLKKKYSILNNLASATATKSGPGSDIINLVLRDGRILKPDVATQYNIDLKELMDPLVKKIPGDTLEIAEQNRVISEIFQMLPYFVFMQGGMAKNEYGYMSVIPTQGMSQLMEEAAQKFLKSSESEKQSIISNFNRKFLYEHNLSHKSTRGKGIDWSNVPATMTFDSDLEESKLIYSTSKPNVYIFSNKAKAAELDHLAKTNPGVTFVINDIFDNTRTNIIKKSKGIRTLKDKNNPYEITPENEAVIKAAIDEDIKDIITAYKAGNKIVLSEAGYAQTFAYRTPDSVVEITPAVQVSTQLAQPIQVSVSTKPVSALNKEFFVYLSKKLLEIGYVNPGSEKIPDILDILSIQQPITEEDIEQAKKDCI